MATALHTVVALVVSLPIRVLAETAHTHTFTPSVSDNISYSLQGDTETRPVNFTKRIWKRIA